MIPDDVRIHRAFILNKFIPNDREETQVKEKPMIVTARVQTPLLNRAFSLKKNWMTELAGSKEFKQCASVILALISD
jgi:hypothetical protein